VNISAVRMKLLSHPWIAEAEVMREMPSKIKIRITEHTPLAILDMGRKFIMNTEGEIFKEWRTQDPANLPVVTGLGYKDLNSYGKPSNIQHAAVMDALNFGDKAKRSIRGMNIRRIHVDREIGLTLYAFDGIRSVELGYHDYAGKYEQLEKIIGYLKKKSWLVNVDSIDIKDKDRIVIKPVLMESPAEQKEV